MASWYIYIAMLVVFAMGIIIAVKLEKYKKDLDKATKKLEENEDSVGKLQKYFNGDVNEQSEIFTDKILLRKLKEYSEACRRKKQIEGEASFVDITDFYNGDFLDEIGYTGICELISGTMTGLGILGTFIGLVYGIGNFNTSSTEAITSSITSLLDGMGTAFWTSIAGVAFSLIFSYIHNICYKRANESIEQFVVCFHKKNLDGSEDTTEKRLLGYQQQQTEFMKNFAVVVSEEIGKSISSSMKTELLPIFSRMETTIEKFGEFASKQQKQSLDQIVKEFINCMNGALKGHFEELGNTIHATCEWQKKSMLELEKLAGSICENADEIKKINETSKNIVLELDKYVLLMNQYQERLSDESKLISNKIDLGNEIADRQAKYIDELVKCEASISNLAESVKIKVETTQQVVETFSTYCEERVDEVTNVSRQNIEEIQKSMGLLFETSNSQLESLTRAAEANISGVAEFAKRDADATERVITELSTNCKDQINEIANVSKQNIVEMQGSIDLLTDTSKGQLETLARVAGDEISKLSIQMSEESNNRLVEFTKASSDQMKAFSDGANRILQDSQRQISESVNSIQNQSNLLLQLATGFSEFTESENKKFMEAVNKEIDGILSVATETSGEIKNATTGMEKAAALLDKNLDSVLERTFTSFDKGLTDISQHLSGTIAEVRDVTEVLPHVIRDSQKQYEKVLSELTQQTRQYLTRMNELTKLAEEMLNNDKKRDI